MAMVLTLVIHRFELRCISNGYAVMNMSGNEYLVKGGRNLVFGKAVCTNVIVALVEVLDSETVVDGGNYTKVMDMGFTLTWRARDCGYVRIVVEDVD
ncbi:hypothetical protein Tco_1335019 [Tanacetum coccineum]